MAEVIGNIFLIVLLIGFICLIGLLIWGLYKLIKSIDDL